MTTGIWLLFYDIAASDRDHYVAWFRRCHISEKLARPATGAGDAAMNAPHIQILTVEAGAHDDTVRSLCAQKLAPKFATKKAAIAITREKDFFKDMIPAKFAPLLLSFFVDHYVLCAVGCGNAERGRLLSDDFTALWAAAWYKRWIFAFPKILVAAPLTRCFVARIKRGLAGDGLNQAQ